MASLAQPLLQGRLARHAQGVNPSLVVEKGKAYVSWDGATDVSAWSVYNRAVSQRIQYPYIYHVFIQTPN